MQLSNIERQKCHLGNKSLGARDPTLIRGNLKLPINLLIFSAVGISLAGSFSHANFAQPQTTAATAP